MDTFPTQSELTIVITQCLEKLFACDHDLISSDVNERTISSRLAFYIQDALPSWHVDCEYNRDGLDTKTTELPVEGARTDDEYGCTVFPDIIVHHRSTRDNLLVVEIKKSSSRIPADRDKQKLSSYCRKPLCYKYALFLKLRTDHRQTDRWISEWFLPEHPTTMMNGAR